MDPGEDVAVADMRWMQGSELGESGLLASKGQEGRAFWQNASPHLLLVPKSRIFTSCATPTDTPALLQSLCECLSSNIHIKGLFLLLLLLLPASLSGITVAECHSLWDSLPCGGAHKGDTEQGRKEGSRGSRSGEGRQQEACSSPLLSLVLSLFSAYPPHS